MLPKLNRLPKQEFRTVFTKGQRIHIPEFQILLMPTHAKNSRFGIIVSKKIDKRAVGRNRIKRILRESLQKILKEFTSPLDCLILVKMNLSDKKSSDMEILLHTVFDGIKIKT